MTHLEEPIQSINIIQTYHLLHTHTSTTGTNFSSPIKGTKKSVPLKSTSSSLSFLEDYTVQITSQLVCLPIRDNVVVNRGVMNKKQQLTVLLCDQNRPKYITHGKTSIMPDQAMHLAGAFFFIFMGPCIVNQI